MIITDTELLADWLKCRRQQPVAFDTETTGLRPYQGDRMIGIAFATCADDAIYVPMRHRDPDSLFLEDYENICVQPLLVLLRREFSDRRRAWVAWNGKFDCHVLRQESIHVQGAVADAMLLSHLADENLRSYSLEAVSKMKKLLPADKRGSLALRAPSEVAPYAEQDCIATMKVYREVLPRLKEDGLLHLSTKVCKYARALEMMEAHGVLIDAKACRQALAASEQRLDILESEIRALPGAWASLNPGSPAAVGKWLGIRRTGKEELEELNDTRVEPVLEYRGLAKACTAFYTPFLEMQDDNGRVHCSFKLHGTVAGRPSCEKPNMQQIPRAGKAFHQARQFVIAPPGRVLLSADYSQAELRLMAHYSEDPFLLKAYCEDGLDIHQMVADAMGVDRPTAKTLNFGMCYGMGVAHLARSLRVIKDIAQKYLNMHGRLMPGVKRLARQTEAQARQEGYIKLWTGRIRRYVVGTWRGDQEPYRTAMNNLIQGGVAEIVRTAIMRIDDLRPPGADMILQVHDEILFEIDEDKVEDTCQAIHFPMEDFRFRVPIRADLKVGPVWGQMKSREWKLTTPASTA